MNKGNKTWMQKLPGTLSMFCFLIDFYAEKGLGQVLAVGPFLGLVLAYIMGLFKGFNNLASFTPPIAIICEYPPGSATVIHSKL